MRDSQTRRDFLSALTIDKRAFQAKSQILSYLIFFGPGQPREAPEHLCHVCPHGGTSSGWFWGGPALWVDPQVQLCAKGARL